MKRIFGLGALALLAAMALPNTGAAQSADGFVATSLGYSEVMLDRQDNVTGKIPFALDARRSGTLQTGRLYFGGRLVASVISERTNTAGKFPILSRLPPSHAAGTSDTFGVVNEIALTATLTLPWVTGFVQGEFTEVEYPGQSDTQWRKVWLAVGDLSAYPVYAAVGRKTVNFGNFASYAPFTHSHSSHYFWAQTEDPLLEIGYVTEDTQLAFSLISSHRGNRVVSSPANDGDYDNFALNGTHRFALGNGMDLAVGAGYLRGTIYDSTIAHHPPDVGIDRDWNGAYTFNATLSGARYDVMAEFTQTEEVWPATGHKVSALTLQGRYRTEIFGKPATLSAMASRGVQGDSGTEWEKMDQIILGLEVQAAKHMSLGLEYMFNDGFVPLILPTIAGDAGVESHTLIAGVKLTF